MHYAYDIYCPWPAHIEKIALSCRIVLVITMIQADIVHCTLYIV